MKLLSKFTLFFLVIAPTTSVCKIDPELNKVDNKIDYLNKRITFLYFDIEKLHEVLARTRSLIYKEQCLTEQLFDKLDEVLSCSGIVKQKSASFRLYKWNYIKLKKLKSKEKHIKHKISLICAEVNKTKLDQEIEYLREFRQSDTCQDCNYITCALDKLIARIEDLQSDFQDLKKETDIIINKIEELRCETSENKQQFCECCCWV